MFKLFKLLNLIWVQLLHFIYESDYYNVICTSRLRLRFWWRCILGYLPLAQKYEWGTSVNTELLDLLENADFTHQKIQNTKKYKIWDKCRLVVICHNAFDYAAEGAVVSEQG